MTLYCLQSNSISSIQCFFDQFVFLQFVIEFWTTAAILLFSLICDMWALIDVKLYQICWLVQQISP